MSEETRRFGGYRGVEWLKFFIPILNASIALFLCFLLIGDCKSSIQVGSEWYGLFSHAPVDGESCVSYTKDSLPPGLALTDSQLVTARVASLIVVLTGSALWTVLVCSPFCRFLNGMWPKLICIITALIIGNVQLLNVAKFVRFVLDGYPEEEVFYAKKVVVVGSIVFWFLTALAVSLCGVRSVPRQIFEPSNSPNASTKKKSAPPSIVRRRTSTRPGSNKRCIEASSSYSGEGDLEESKCIHLVYQTTSSEDTNETNDSMEGDGVLLASISVDTPETKDTEDVEIVLSASSEGTMASI